MAEANPWKRWWITRYGPLGSSFQPLDSLDKRALIEVIIGKVDYKLEELTQEERNSREASDGE